MKLLIFFFSSAVCFCFLSPSGAVNSSVPDHLPIRAVNFGGWLVTEGWIKPSLFSQIPNKDFLDGTSMQLKSVKWGKYLSAEGGGGGNIVANRTEASGWETLTLWRMNATNFKFRVFNKNFVGVSDENYTVVAVANTSDEASAGMFEIERNSQNSSLVRIKAPNGSYLQAKTEDLVTADYRDHDDGGKYNSSVFMMTIVRTLQGEYQITNGYGPKLAPKVMQEHWKTFIVKKDFKFIKDNGLNAVRIPVGWWINKYPPPKPYVAGSLQALDKAFFWAKKYEIKVIIDLHAAPGSQNGMEHSSTRDGTIEWGHTEENINKTVEVIEFLTARYTDNPSLFAVELINEPLSSGVPLSNLSTYYKYGYDAVRRHSRTAYVVLSNRLGSNEPRELFNITTNMNRSVVDVHYYNLYWDYYNNLTVEQNIEYVRINRTAELKELTTPNGPLVFVGEWTNVLPYNTSKDELIRYGKAQLEVFGNATFGWAYWTLSNVNNNWNLTWMIKNGYIKLT